MRQSNLFAIIACVGLVVSGLAVSGLALAKGPGMAGGVAFKFGPDLSANNWRNMSFPRRRPAEFRARGADTLIVQAESGVGVLWHPVPLEVSKARKARWRWRVAAGVGPTDLTKKGGDDRTLAVYFVFVDGQEVPDNLDLMRLLQQQRGHLLMYVWGGSANPGTVLTLPYFSGRRRTVVKRPANAPTDVWFDEMAEVRDDFHRAFGHWPGRLVAVPVSSDSDDTGGLNIAAVANLCVN